MTDEQRQSIIRKMATASVVPNADDDATNKFWVATSTAEVAQWLARQWLGGDAQERS